MKTDELFELVSRDQAIVLQRELASRVIHIDDSGLKPSLLCGMDVSYDGEDATVAAAVWHVKRREFVERIHLKQRVLIGYFPGLLGFREGPLSVSVARRLRSKPDVFLVDGHGAAHPRRFGLACHFGVAVNRPTVGVAKSQLYGKINDNEIVNPEGEIIGHLIVNPNGKKFYVSVGHRISLDTASRLVKDSFVEGHPAPLRQAHLDSIQLKEDSSR